jgi:hypothetical protein
MVHKHKANWHCQWHWCSPQAPAVSCLYCVPCSQEDGAAKLPAPYGNFAVHSIALLKTKSIITDGNKV